MEENNEKVALTSSSIPQGVEEMRAPIKILVIHEEIQDTEMIMTIMMVIRKREDILVTVAKHPDINRREDDIAIEIIPNWCPHNCNLSSIQPVAEMDSQIWTIPEAFSFH